MTRISNTIAEASRILRRPGYVVHEEEETDQTQFLEITYGGVEYDVDVVYDYHSLYEPDNNSSDTTVTITSIVAKSCDGDDRCEVSDPELLKVLKEIASEIIANS